MNINIENWKMIRTERQYALNYITEETEELCECENRLCSECRFHKEFELGLPEPMEIVLCSHPKHPLNALTHDELLARIVAEEL